MSATRGMKWASAISDDPSLRQGLAVCATEVRAQLDDSSCDLALVFVSSLFRDHFHHVPEMLQEHLSARTLVGCSAGGVIGGGKEIEQRAAVSISASRMPDVTVHAFHSDTRDLPDADASPEAWLAWAGLQPREQPHFILLADPFTAAVEQVLNGLDYAFPQSTKVGGLASGGNREREHALFLGNQVYPDGLVAVALTGNVCVDTVVAQGCRPIGPTAAVTRCEQNVVMELDRVAPITYLMKLVESLSESDRKLAQRSLFLGIQADQWGPRHEPGGFLIRNVVGVDYHTGAIAVGALPREGQVIQFHLRDRETSAEDLHRMLAEYRKQANGALARGALLFSCLGRGSYLYREAGHDSRIFGEEVGPMPLGGFFCNGEIGPVGPTTHLHGYTSAFGLFRERDTRLA